MDNAKAKDKPKDGCVKPAKGVVKPGAGAVSGGAEAAASATTTPQEDAMSVKVGYPAPDFEATAYVNGGFDNVSLSDYKGQWVMICFYPGDFTFV